MLTPIKYIGSKVTLAPLIIDLMPAHTCYVEVFGGSGAVLFAKHPEPEEVYNDYNDHLVSMYRTLRDPEKPRN